MTGETTEPKSEIINRAFFYLKFRPRTVTEMQRYLKKTGTVHKWNNEEIDRAIDYLCEHKYLNDKEFIEWFISSRASRKQKSAFIIKGELIRMGIDRELIDAHLNQYPLDEEALAEAALTKAESRYKHYDSKKRHEKLLQFLIRRGFSWSTAQKVVDKRAETK